MTLRLLPLAFFLAIIGCRHRPAQPKYDIPHDCLKVRITDFTEPCKTLNQWGDLLCDGVRVHINCTGVRIP